MKCFRRLLGVTYHDRRTNQSLLEEINDIIGARMRLANEVKKFKVADYPKFAENRICKFILSATSVERA